MIVTLLAVFPVFVVTAVQYESVSGPLVIMVSIPLALIGVGLTLWLTTVFGMLPLALGLGEGSELMQPLAITVVGGLTVSTLLTLLVVPCVYLIVDVLSLRMRRFLTGAATGH